MRSIVRPQNDSRIQEIEVEPVREHVAGANRGGEHEGGGGMVRRQAHDVRLQGKMKKDGSHYRCIWGKVSRPTDQRRRRAKFKSNLPQNPWELKLGFFMYPSNI
ncbi:60S ribosomal protein L35a-4 [Iris pallida]|uniref:60S ribosomal protein L35a-4 n=1 Tax=Iris pallida TaxID=29817 RepID=A0AAX6IM30_IRIPA|nr:60S ribosomal protein L35a-4 [Iris pallida]